MSESNLFGPVPGSSAQAYMLDSFSMTASLLLGLCGLVVVLMPVSGIAWVLLGFWVNLIEVWFPWEMGWADSVVHLWLLSPLVDVAETVRPSRKDCGMTGLDG